MSNHHLVLHAEYCAEMATEAESKAEADRWWREYKQIMEVVSPGCTRKPKCYTNQPTQAFVRLMNNCPCGSILYRWSRKKIEYQFDCKCNRTGFQMSMKNGIETRRCLTCNKESKPQKTGIVVKFICPHCKYETKWHPRNIDARKEWNERYT